MGGRASQRALPAEDARGTDDQDGDQDREHDHADHPPPGEEPGDFSGLPINEAARYYGDSWDVARHSVIEHQYRFEGPTDPGDEAIVRVYDTARDAYSELRQTVSAG